MGDTLFAVGDLDIDFVVGGQTLPALRDLTFELKPGEVLGIVGESGSGKSTILFAAMQYVAANARIPKGEIMLGSDNLLTLGRAQLDRVRGAHIAMVFQDPTSALNPSMRIGDQITEGIIRHQGMDTAAARDRALAWMERVQLEDPKTGFAKYPHELSGGQRQRVMIALALALEPDVLLMDEPTTALDVVVQAHILDLVRQLAVEENLALVFVTHDLGAVAKVADSILVLYAGEVVEKGPTGEVLCNPAHPYTQGLLAALPQLDRKARTVAIPGSISGEVGRFAACVFANRCAHTQDICRNTRPELEARMAGSSARCHFDALTNPVNADTGMPAPSETANVGTPLLELRKVSLEYKLKTGSLASLLPWRSNSFEAVRDVSFRLPVSGSLAIVGESGSGKSTLARAILGLMPVANGSITYRGEDTAGFAGAALRAYRQNVQIVFQNPTSSMNPRKCILDQVARPMLLMGHVRDESLNAAAEMLASVGLDDSFHDRIPSALSGGQLQRVAIARAFVTQPDLLILDEPTTALDVSVQAGILELLADLKARNGCTFLLISHDLAVVRQIAQEVLVIKRGDVCEIGLVDQVFSSPAHPYTKQLLDAAKGV